MDGQNAIELFVDQQVFIDVVGGAEQIVEFTALTEVTTFEQRGEFLFLEGNILFTAYMQTSSGAPDASEETVEHVQHRMPFDVLLPVNSQTAGILNVSVRVSNATLDVLGPGWIHIRAFVEVDGLSPSGGYTAHCGAQEAVVHATVVDTVDFSETSEVMELAETIKEVEYNPITVASDDTKESVEDALAVRSEWLKELEGADRALNGPMHPFRAGMPPVPSDSIPQPSSSDPIVSLQEDVRSQEHSLIEENIEPTPTPSVPEPTPEVLLPDAIESGEDLHREWSINAEPLQPEIFPAPTPTVILPMDSSSSPPMPELEQEPQAIIAKYIPVPESPVEMSAAQWFWKTMNVPSQESHYAMKFRIVSESESIDEIAQFYNVSVMDLMSVNRMTPDGVVPGCLLFIPHHG